jgi:hypothetical protein
MLGIELDLGMPQTFDMGDSVRARSNILDTPLLDAPLLGLGFSCHPGVEIGNSSSIQGSMSDFNWQVHVLTNS